LGFVHGHYPHNIGKRCYGHITVPVWTNRHEWVTMRHDH
jgi:Fe-S cluster biosynthesis and repair protein YggX